MQNTDPEIRLAVVSGRRPQSIDPHAQGSLTTGGPAVAPAGTPPAPSRPPFHIQGSASLRPTYPVPARPLLCVCLAWDAFP